MSSVRMARKLPRVHGDGSETDSPALALKAAKKSQSNGTTNAAAITTRTRLTAPLRTTWLGGGPGARTPVLAPVLPPTGRGAAGAVTSLMTRSPPVARHAGR